MKSILITGGTGFIGSHTAAELLREDKKVIIVDNLSNSSESVVENLKKLSGKQFDFYKADIGNKEVMENIFSKNEINAVIHFAGFKAVGESVKNPILYYKNNVCETVSLLETMQKAECKNIIFSSSATVYGDKNPIPYKEEMPLSATNPYGQTKIVIEQMLLDICKSDKDWSAVSLRYFNPIGADESGLIGEDPNGVPNNLVPYIAKVALGELEALNIFGNDYNTKDGTGVRDYIHIKDLAKAHINALNYALNNKGFEPFNIGSGKGYSVFDVLKSYEKACGKKLPFFIKERRAGDIDEFYADSSKAKEILDFETKYDLDDMTRSSWNYVNKSRG